MRKAGFFLIGMVAVGCMARPLIKPLKPLEIATAPYHDFVTATLAGSLMYEGGCLLFRDEQTGAYLLPVWPQGSSFNGTAVLFHQPSKADQRVMVAEEFAMGGQLLRWSALLGPDYVPFQRQCAGYEPFFVSTVRPAN